MRALALDAPGLAEALDALDEKERAEARAWVLSDKTFFSTLREREPQPLRFDDPTRDLYGAAPWLRVMCLIATCSPAEAARAVQWEHIWDHMTPVARDQ